MDDRIRWALLRMALGTLTLEQFKKGFGRDMTNEEERYYLGTKKGIEKDKKDGVKAVYYVAND